MAVNNPRQVLLCKVQILTHILYVEISVTVTREIVALQSPVQLWYLNPVQTFLFDFFIFICYNMYRK